MFRCNRRRFIVGFGGAVMLPLAWRVRAAAGTRIRANVASDEGARMLDKYALAVERMREAAKRPSQIAAAGGPRSLGDGVEATLGPAIENCRLSRA